MKRSGARSARGWNPRSRSRGERTGTGALDFGIVVLALATLALLASAVHRSAVPDAMKESLSHVRAGIGVNLETPAGRTGSPPAAGPGGERASGIAGGPSATGLASAVRVQVLNGCGVSGAAANVASLLRRAGGFDVIEIGNAENFDFAVTVVVDRTGDARAAREVARVLDGVPLVLQRLPGGRFEVTVIVGYDHGRWPGPVAGSRP